MDNSFHRNKLSLLVLSNASQIWSKQEREEDWFFFLSFKNKHSYVSHSSEGLTWLTLAKEDSDASEVLCLAG